MEVKKAIKRIIALGAGATLIGATIMGAMAASLANYPSPFVEDGKFDGMIVVGDNAKAEDVIGATDIAMSLQYSMVKSKTVSMEGEASSVVLEGDSWKAESSSEFLEQGEDFTDVLSAISEGELEALGDGEFKVKNNVDYEQELRFSGKFNAQYDEDEEDERLGNFLYIPEDNVTMTYKMTFDTPAESDIDSTDSVTLEDFEDATITLLGMEYVITEAVTDGLGNATLTLMSGAINDIMEEGETKTFTLEGKDYEVTVDYIGGSTPAVKFTVNGEVSKSLLDDETDEVAGLDIGVRDILENEAGEAAGGDKVEFYLGADKIVLDGVDQDMEVKEEKMDNVVVTITGTHGAPYQLEEIELVYSADEEFWIGAGEKLSEKLDEPEALLNWDISYEGLAEAGLVEMEISAETDQAELTVELADGEVDIPLAYASGSLLTLGDDDDALILTGDIAKDEYFILTTEETEDGKSFFLQYKGVTDDDTQIMTFKNMVTGKEFERTYRDPNATMTLGGTEFTVINKSEAVGYDDWDISISGGSGSLRTFVTEGGANVSIADVSANGNVSTADIDVTITEIDVDMLDDGSQTPVVISVGVNSDIDEIDIAKPTGVTMEIDPDVDDLKIGTTVYGTKFIYDSDSDENNVKIEWPVTQLFHQAFVTSGAVSSMATEAEAGELVTQSIVKIDVGAAVLASEVAGEETSHNLIMVGGPCANSAAAVIMGNPENCAEGFETGKAKVKLYENSGNVAMLVAGATALDTRGAAQFVAKYAANADTFADASDEIALTVTSLSSITASIPSAE